jgi:hypothetical protein
MVTAVKTPNPTQEVLRYAVLFSHLTFLFSWVQTPRPEICSQPQSVTLLCKEYFHTHTKEQLKL